MVGHVFSVLTVLCLLFDGSFQGFSRSYKKARSLHSAVDLTDDEVSTVARMTDMNNFNIILENILVPRVVGTVQHDKVADYIVKAMENIGWHVERDRFKDTTPVFGQLEFQNIIAKLNPAADRFLVLACHYDSKYVREHNFVGATDSAVPCSQMINLAYVMKRQLDASKRSSAVSLQLIFFDGEEAFRQWGPTDSIYGARHLASKMEKSTFRTPSGETAHQLDQIDLLILLDLLGARNPKFYSYFADTARWFGRLSEAEERLGEMGQLRGPRSQYFVNRHYGAHIEDDHIPFLRRDVPILHLIPTPFPDVWHKPSDNRSAVDMDTVENINKVLRVFVSEYLGLNL
nr:glutaminyl-peptide cyclotransferase [Limnephilus flavicornis]